MHLICSKTCMKSRKSFLLFQTSFSSSNRWHFMKDFFFRTSVTTNEKVIKNRCENKSRFVSHNFFRWVSRAVNNIKNCAKFDKFILTRSRFSRFSLSEVLNEFFTHNFYAKDFLLRCATEEQWP